jgi:hypothetical protein
VYKLLCHQLETLTFACIFVVPSYRYLAVRHLQVNPIQKIMIALKPLLFALLAGTSAAFAVMQPRVPSTIRSKTAALKLSSSPAAAADTLPPELKVCFVLWKMGYNFHRITHN